MRIVSVRLSAEELQMIKTLVKQEGKRRSISIVVRELIREGFIYKALQAHRDGQKSLGSLAHDLGLSLSATINLLSKLGIESPLTYQDYLESVETLQKTK